jgi:hypothetical protein
MADLQPPPADARPARHPDVAWRSWGGEVVILTPAGHDAKAAAAMADGAEHDLNEVGSRIWELCDGRRTLPEIASVLVEEFEVDPVEARVDVAAFVAQLLEMKLLVLQAQRP